MVAEIAERRGEIFAQRIRRRRRRRVDGLGQPIAQLHADALGGLLADAGNRREPRQVVALDRAGQVARLDARQHRQRQLRSNAADRKSTRLNSSHSQISYAVFCLKKKKKKKKNKKNL